MCLSITRFQKIMYVRAGLSSSVDEAAVLVPLLFTGAARINEIKMSFEFSGCFNIKV